MVNKKESLNWGVTPIIKSRVKLLDSDIKQRINDHKRFRLIAGESSSQNESLPFPSEI